MLVRRLFIFRDSLLCTELGLPDPSPMSLSVDNQGAIDLAYNPEHHQRTKHIERRHFFIREAVERGEIHVRVPFVKTDDNIADFFTKPLSSKRFFSLRDRMMNVPSGRQTLVDYLFHAKDKYVLLLAYSRNITTHDLFAISPCLLARGVLKLMVLECLQSCSQVRVS